MIIAAAKTAVNKGSFELHTIHSDFLPFLDGVVVPANCNWRFYFNQEIQEICKAQRPDSPGWRCSLPKGHESPEHYAFALARIDGIGSAILSEIYKWDDESGQSSDASKAHNIHLLSP